MLLLRGQCKTWATIMADERRRGTTIAHVDAWVAATAQLEGLSLITNNVRHFGVVAGLTLQTETLV